MECLLESREVDGFSHEGFVVDSKHVDAQPYVGAGAEVTLDELDGFIASIRADLGAEEGDPFFVLYHEALAPGQRAFVEICRPSSTEDATGELPPGEVVYTTASGERAEYPRIAHAYDALTLWAQDHGREVASPAREAYLADGSLEISKPLRQPG